jgi:hypothetical protein
MTWLLTLLLCLCAASAWAQDAPVGVEPRSAELALEPDLELGEPDPTEGFGVFSLGVDLGFVNQGLGDRNRAFSRAPGVSLQILASRRTWPVMVGLGFGLMAVDSMRDLRLGRAASTRHSTEQPDDWSDQPAVQLRHAELVTRYQPLWGPLRPYAEVALGGVAFWNAGAEQQRAGSVLYTAVLGLDWRLHEYAPGSSGTWSLMLTTAFKWMGTGPIERPRLAVVDGANGRGYASDWTREPLGMWTPFVGLTFANDSRHEARAREPPLPER